LNREWTRIDTNETRAGHASGGDHRMVKQKPGEGLRPVSSRFVFIRVHSWFRFCMIPAKPSSATHLSLSSLSFSFIRPTHPHE
jgi:hypothetical protein